jgi:hypothetical protein
VVCVEIGRQNKFHFHKEKRSNKQKKKIRLPLFDDITSIPDYNSLKQHTMMMKPLHLMEGDLLDTTSASCSISLQTSTKQLLWQHERQQHLSPTATAALTEYAWEHDWSDDEHDDDYDEYNCDKKRPKASFSYPEQLVRYFYRYSSSAVGGGYYWITPPLLALVTQVVSLVCFSSPLSSTSSISAQQQPQPLFCPLVCFNVLVAVVTAWLHYEHRKQEEQQQHTRVLLCLPEILTSLTTLFFWLDLGKLAFCTLMLCALALSLLILQALLNQLVGFTSPLPSAAAAVTLYKQRTQQQSTTRSTRRVPRVIQFETNHSE